MSIGGDLQIGGGEGAEMLSGSVATSDNDRDRILGALRRDEQRTGAGESRKQR